ncbi:molybdopterin-dependent oxidoreductase [Micromonosporaceae bacterium Da 78-11]
MQSTRSWWAGAVATVLLLAACDSGTSTPARQSSTAARVVGVAALTPGQKVPAPVGTALFTMTGKVSTTNRGSVLAFDQRTVESLGMVQVELFEPWTKADMEFRGVWLKDIVAVAAVPADATRLHITALDDYTVDLELADVRAGGILLATRAGDGSSIPIDEGGPSRVVFLDGVAAGANADQWVWSVKEISVQ